jgi:multicomponent Na+:H+ antiporter subunit E
MNLTTENARYPRSSWLWRGMVYFAFWVILIGLDPLDLAIGGFAAAAATWTSLRLLPPGTHRVRLAGLPRLALRFLWQSIVAGVDVAYRAFAPRMPLRPGWVRYPTRYPRGPARNAFASLTSLLPGTVPVHDDDEGLLYHCLDTRQPIAEQLAEEEIAVSRALPHTTQP